MCSIKGDGKEQEENEDECDVVGNLTGDSSKGGDIEKGSSSVGGGGKLSKQSIAAENLKVFTQVRHTLQLYFPHVCLILMLSHAY
jgi:hypothetical protein